MSPQTQPPPKAMQRLPQYLAYLKVQQKKGQTAISSTIIARDLRLNPVQVRKDLAMASSAGRPKTGYPIATLVDDLERYLGFHNTQDAFVIGVGRLGSALLAHQAFGAYGLNILAGFDVLPALHGQEIAGKPVFSMDRLENLVRRMRVNIGILAVPGDAAQQACDAMIRSGILAVWNFTPAPLLVPGNILLHNENLAVSFAILSKRLANALETDDPPTTVPRRIIEDSAP